MKNREIYFPKFFDLTPSDNWEMTMKIYSSMKHIELNTKKKYNTHA